MKQMVISTIWSWVQSHEIMQCKCSFHIECQRWLHSCYFYLWTAAGLSPSRSNQCQSEAVCFVTEFWSYPRASKRTHKVHEFFILTTHIKAIYRCLTLYWSVLNSKERDDACTGWVHYVQQFNLWEKIHSVGEACRMSYNWMSRCDSFPPHRICAFCM